MRRHGRRLRLALASLVAVAGAAALAGQGGCALVVGADFDDKTLRGPCAPCYSGPPQTEGRGVCVSGCQEGDACAGEVIPTTERCATPADDDNCDGAAACDGEPLLGWQYGDVFADESPRVAVGPDGSVILAHRAQGTIDYGGGPKGSGQPEPNVHVVKLDARGNHVWSASYGDLLPQSVGGVVADTEGNIVITGTFAGTLDFGTATLASNASSDDVFVAKLDPGGSLLWAHGYGDGAPQFGARAAVGADGSVVVVGGLDGTVDFGGVPLTSNGSYDIFVLKLDRDGNHLWSSRFGDTSDQRVTDVAIGPQGEIALTGFFAGALDFGGGALTNGDTLFDGFVAELGANGEHRWTRHLQGDVTMPGNIGSYGVAVDADGTVFAVGHFSGGLLADTETLLSAGANDVFLVSYAADGSLRFAKQFGDASEQVGLTVRVDAVGAVVMAGYGAGELNFGLTPVPLALDTDAFVAKLDRDGEAFWARYIGGGGTQSASSVAPDPLGDVLVAGSNDGAIQIGAEVLQSRGQADTWLARLRP